jgi:hypothetical protein
MSEQKLDCPDCSTPIPYDTYGFLQGKKFSCPNCKLSIGLAAQSHDTVKDAMEEFENLKVNLLKQEDSSMQGSK